MVLFLMAMDWTRAAVSMSMLSNIGQSQEAFHVEMGGGKSAASGLASDHSRRGKSPRWLSPRWFAENANPESRIPSPRGRSCI